MQSTDEPLDPERVRIVLVRPARAGNVAGACRAMKNMGVSALTLVDPPPELTEPEARRLAYGAWDVLDQARLAPSLADAVADCSLVVGTSGKASEEAWSPGRLAREGGARAAGGAAIVFGPESSGLTTAERALCHLEVRIPSNPAHPSLNLAQAVLIVCYEILLAGGPASVGEPEVAPLASSGEMEAALADLESGLLGIGYLNPARPDAILAELRRLLARARPTLREASLLRGIARQIGWAAARIAPRPPRSG